MYRENKKLSSWGPWLGVFLLALVPFVSQFIGLDYYIGFVMRLLMSVIIVTSLNFLLGYGGMAALGHAGFIGVGSYAMVAMIETGITSVWMLWLGATVITAIWATLIGLIVLRTSGIYFLMSTLAFAEMTYYIAVSLRQYGGDDGYILSEPLNFGMGFDTGSTSILYGLVLVIVVLTFLFFNRMVDSRFGKAIMGIRDNSVRMRALGYPVFRLQLQAFVIGSAAAGLGGAMMMTQNGFISPSAIHWTHSAELLVIVTLGGMGYKWGAVLGAGFWGVLKEFLPQITDYWHWPMGLFAVIVILYAPNGLCSIFSQIRTNSDGVKWLKLVRRSA